MSAQNSIKVKNTLALEQHAEVLAGWSEEYMQMSPGLFQGRVLHAKLGGVEVFEERMNQRVQQSYQAPAKSIVFSFDMAEDTLYILDENTQNTWITPENYCELSIVISGDSLPKNPGALSVHELILKPLKSPHCRLFSRWLAKVINDCTLAPQNVSESIFSQLMDDCIFILEHGITPENRTEPRQARDAVKKVLEIMNEAPANRYRASDLSEIAGVSLKHLKSAFTTHCGMTLSEWLKNLRLNAVRSELISSSPADATVTEIAMKWSFWHLGRFSNAYRELFGEFPLETLRRRH